MHQHISNSLSVCIHTVQCGSVQIVAVSAGTSLQPGQRGHHWCPGAVFCLCLYCFNGVRLASTSPLWFIGGMVSGSTAVVWQSKTRSLGYIHDFTKSSVDSLCMPPPREHLILIQICWCFQVIAIYFLSWYYYYYYYYYYVHCVLCSTNWKQDIDITYNSFCGFSINVDPLS